MNTHNIISFKHITHNTCKISESENKIRIMITSQLSRAFLCKGRRERKYCNNTNNDRRHPFGISLFHLFRKTASANNSSAVKNGARTKNDDDNNKDNNSNTNINNNDKSKARSIISAEKCDDGASASSFLSLKSYAEMEIMMRLENKVKKYKKDSDDDTVELSTPSPIPRQIITRQITDDDDNKPSHIISIPNVPQLLVPSIDDDDDDSSSSSSPSSSSPSSSSSRSSSSASSSTGILRLPARQPLGLNAQINNADDFDDLDLWDMYVFPLYEEEYKRSSYRFQTPPVADVIVPNNVDYYTALKQTKDRYNSNNKRRRSYLSGPPMRVDEWDHHTIESNPRVLLPTNGTTNTLSDNNNRRRSNNKRCAALLQQVQQIQRQKHSLYSNNNKRWGDVHPRLLSTLNQTQQQLQHQHQHQHRHQQQHQHQHQPRVVKWNMIHNNSW
jgi:hypothetical protein